jgi:hypothetical protein
VGGVPSSSAAPSAIHELLVDPVVAAKSERLRARALMEKLQKWLR